ncbi:2-hydroxymuconate tautomerase [Marinobacter adhaerens]|jgi:4-oxalocrotonate tautomerase|uniref:Tautomerase n=2 Tax=Marinobacter adhaerens TaxID=1033846 RepID=A0ABX8INC5_9GAMM|nr:2-hydroxymuconate tautomerase [Marinobacter adhaerens]MCR9189993.1 4-oxalocrotonate tautomerase family protein [Alteromonadaceae bacterium]MTI77733.1 4-oxalocrotonate tautomerase family protein [Marinobacter sp.]ADP96881.1 4-oxalocrotonate tautomerase [Marinobacter adhaerens HP15]ODM28829.1 2-hydroxymuconate tautomerase [Marinobacter adhaerens]QWV14836.1 4-oxalocrotonate tautomerase family protein [Marinobacter adhaerens]
MPVAQINILEGRSDEQKEMLIREVTDAISRSLGAPVESIRIIITEMPKQHFGIGGQSAKMLGR